jgi:hypothetical protein
MSLRWFEKLGLQHPVLDDNVAAAGRRPQPRKAISASTEWQACPTQKAFSREDQCLIAMRSATQLRPGAG